MDGFAIVALSTVVNFLQILPALAWYKCNKDPTKENKENFASKYILVAMIVVGLALLFYFIAGLFVTGLITCLISAAIYYYFYCCLLSYARVED